MSSDKRFPRDFVQIWHTAFPRQNAVRQSEYFVTREDARRSCADFHRPRREMSARLPGNGCRAQIPRPVGRVFAVGRPDEQCSRRARGARAVRSSANNSRECRGETHATRPAAARLLIVLPARRERIVTRSTKTARFLPPPGRTSLAGRSLPRVFSGPFHSDEAGSVVIDKVITKTSGPEPGRGPASPDFTQGGSSSAGRGISPENRGNFTESHLPTRSSRCRVAMASYSRNIKARAGSPGGP